jgi:hypothetical protein
VRTLKTVDIRASYGLKDGVFSGFFCTQREQSKQPFSLAPGKLGNFIEVTSLHRKHNHETFKLVYPKIGICSHTILKRNNSRNALMFVLYLKNRNNAFQMLHYNLSFEQQKLFILNASL